MKITSCSKWLSAATIMTLVDDGRIDLDAPLSRYLPDLGLRKGWITIRQLLSHTSGYTPRARLRGRMPRGPGGRIGPVARYAPLVAHPGTRFCYGSASFQVAGQVAERVTGQRWNEIFDERIARPCGLIDTRFPAAHPQLAAGAVSTAADYATFVEMFRLGGVAPNGRRVLSAAAVDEMRRQHTIGLELECVSHRFRRKEGYGLGVWGGQYDDTGRAWFVSHFGDLGFKGLIDFRKQLSAVFAVQFKRKNNRPVAKQRFIDAVELLLRLAPD
jgi:CubicO group peptidase (beta-lactamase class C family)